VVVSQKCRYFKSYGMPTTVGETYVCSIPSQAKLIRQDIVPSKSCNTADNNNTNKIIE